MSNNLPRAFFAASGMMLLLQLTGCAIPGRPINATSELTKTNSMNKIAVLGSSRVVWPRMGQKEPVLGLEASKETLIAVMPMLQQEFSSKGYQVIVVEPIAVGFSSPKYKENWVFPGIGEFVEPTENAQDEQTKKTSTPIVGTTSTFGKPYQLTNGDPAYVYPEAEKKVPLAAAKIMFEYLERKIPDINPFAPVNMSTQMESTPTDALLALQQTTGADTLCFARVDGRRFTTARKTGVTALNFATILIGVVVIPPTDSASMTISCFDANHGQLVWQNLFQYLGDPEKPNPAASKDLLSYFPMHGQPLSSTCVVDVDQKNMYRCKSN